MNSLAFLLLSKPHPLPGEPTERRCSQCDEVRERDKFYNNKGNVCKVCHAKNLREARYYNGVQTLKCEWCGKAFGTRTSLRFCSQTCSNRFIGAKRMKKSCAT